MLNALRAVQRIARETVGWNRVGFMLSITVIVIAGVVLYRMLQGIEIEDILDALRATSWHQIVFAGLFVAAGYFTLTFYDLFALRTIERRDVPYRIAALAGFTSYSIGHNVGASVFTGGAVRYRIYSQWGLTAVEVAKICFIAGLTFWLGNATVLGLGIAYAPQAASAIDQLPPWFNRAVAIVILAVLIAYVAWVWRAPRQIGRSNWLVTLPNGPSTLLQIGIGIIDLGCCAFAMYMLMPDEPHIGFVTLAVIFVSATLLGFASHAPGGIGVFDATMLIALWQFDREDVLAGLLLFRMIYYVLPFTLALTILGVREFVVNLAGTRGGATAVPATAVQDGVVTTIEREREARSASRSTPSAAPSADPSAARQRRTGPS
jgi:glycosyltransferase 2 family protein